MVTSLDVSAYSYILSATKSTGISISVSDSCLDLVSFVVTVSFISTIFCCQLWFFGLWHHLALWVVTNIVEKYHLQLQNRSDFIPEDHRGCLHCNYQTHGDKRNVLMIFIKMVRIIQASGKEKIMTSDDSRFSSKVEKQMSVSNHKVYSLWDLNI